MSFISERLNETLLSEAIGSIMLSIFSLFSYPKLLLFIWLKFLKSSIYSKFSKVKNEINRKKLK